MKANRRKFQIANLIRAIGVTLTLLFASATPVQAQPQNSQVDLATFIQRVHNGDAATLRGIYVPGGFSFPIVQQPASDSSFVSRQPYEVTEFQQAQRAGSVGLLAHNDLAGRLFSNIRQGDQIVLVYGDGRTEIFSVSEILAYQALPYGQYRDLQTQDILHTGKLFKHVYQRGQRLTLQTCIENEGDYEWGRLFIIAEPLKDTSK